MTPYPLTFEPLLKPRVWGGRALERLGKRLPAGELIGESWELADLPESIPAGRSIIANGELRGVTLRHAIAQFHDQIMGDGMLSPAGGFPLLIKFLDAQQNLSVQVHPDARYAAAHPDAHLKSEAWVIVTAQPGAVIYKGVKPHVTTAQLASDVQRGGGAVVDDLIAVPAHVGECHYVPSGLCHALGGGVVVAEIQTPSDTTFRLYDWDRPQTAGRSLHLNQALECMRLGETNSFNLSPHAPPVGRRQRLTIEVDQLRITHLCETDHFDIEQIEALQTGRGDSIVPVVTSGLPQVWMVLRGSGRIQTFDGPNVDVSAGTTVLLPAELAESTAFLQPGAWVLRITLPSPLKGMIA